MKEQNAHDCRALCCLVPSMVIQASRLTCCSLTLPSVLVNLT